ncbi:beta-L-arabinofuranosidase domain-containing protein [Plantactinospora endophytica]|uniref:Glycosyl hydrolase n=1 Tax=Plantactinospora endophytica TaxID=673535 RepID=A0ABQ4EEV6_9ACTN|nr:beta-L-arabinofuranosidase domain-containing protein [Plantactinospora endophytica]GIG93261.1 hypothetical protein Pen02_81970 [Plantactinospora endophytica]
MADRVEPADRARLAPDSYLGERVAGNLRRLLAVDLDPLLAGFRRRPGAHPWIGEHIGKWLDAASLTWHATGDEGLRVRLDAAAAALVGSQEADGYLGTYAPGVRLGRHPDPRVDWDVWVHKYALLGLLSYYRTTGEPRALDAARRAGDLLVSTFGPDGEGRDIIAAGTHTGMAATSVLEPMVLLYRHTGEPRYLAFAEHILRAWDQPNGPGVLTRLARTGRVSEVGNGKAYEMLSNIVGLVELARVTGEKDHLVAAVRGWRDVVAHHRYLTGTASFGEHFHRPDELPDSTSVNMGETCVTVTWLHLTRQLFALTGESGYADEIERTLFNHLRAAQLPDGSGWSYYTPLDGYREFGGGITCCLSSGPRGLAAAAASVFAVSAGRDELVVSLYQDASAAVELDGRTVEVTLSSGVPFEGGAVVSFDLTGAARFGLRLRRPAWATGFGVAGASDADGWAVLPSRLWRGGDRVTVDFGLGAHTVEGTGWNASRVALGWGPLVLGYRAHGAEPAIFDVLDGHPAGPLTQDRPAHAWRVANRLAPGGRRDAVLAPFADLGADGLPTRVWLGRPGEEADVALSAFHGAAESRSSGSLRRGSVADYDLASFAATEVGPADEEHWFALALAHPVTFTRVVVAHGRSLAHGGWFDTTDGKPRLAVRRDDGGPWETIATVDAYPATTAADHGGLRAGEVFEIPLATPVTATALRLTGRGSRGEYGPRVFVTCARLAAY